MPEFARNAELIQFPGETLEFKCTLGERILNNALARSLSCKMSEKVDSLVVVSLIDSGRQKSASTPLAVAGNRSL